MRKILWLFLVIGSGFLSNIQASTLVPGDIAEYTFTTNPITFPCAGGCDTLLFSPNYSGLTGAPVVTILLYDGSNLLGTFTSAACCSGAFVTAASSYGFGAPIVDFTTILNGTIQGRLDLSVSGGSITGIPQPGSLLVLGHSASLGGVSGDSRSATLSSVVTITPEPSTFGMLSVALSGLCLCFRRRPTLKR